MKTVGFAVRVFMASLPALLFAAPPDKSPAFDSEIRPLLQAKCWACHGETSPQANLSLRTPESIVKGGKSGPAVKPGSSAGSLLIEKVVSKAMPPGDAKLSPNEIALLRSWVDNWSGAAEREVTENDVLPIFQMRCVVCHGKRKQEGGLDLRSQASRLRGGKSGPAIIPGKPDQSLLMQKISSGQMPPPKLLFEYFVRPPTSPEVETLRKWIAAGAPPAPREAIAEAATDPLVSEKDRAFWSFQPPKRPAIPEIENAANVRNPIDAFLLQKLETKNLTFAKKAEPPVLLRRACLDLTGLPPTQAQIRE
jgi:mono/diheme cytochrome c family protein